MSSLAAPSTVSSAKAGRPSPFTFQFTEVEPPRFAHQIEDSRSLIDKPEFALFVEPGGGKSRTVVDAMCELWHRGEVDAVIVVCPAPARSVWADPNRVLGEIARWAWENVPYHIHEFHQKFKFSDVEGCGLPILVTNPEFVRRKERLQPLQVWARRRKTLLVLDEAWQYKTPNATQTRAMQRLRACCTRVVLLNGTPGTPADQYAQFRILNPAILDSFNHQAFRARFCIMGGFQNRKVVGFQRTDEFHAKTSPFCVIRKLRDIVDLGPEPIRTQIEARLTPQTWKLYTELRDELVTWLSAHESVTAMQAGVKTMRLAQITSGFVGGVVASDAESVVRCDRCGTFTSDIQAELRLFNTGQCACGGDLAAWVSQPPSPMREVGREKLDALIAWLTQHWSDPKLLVFDRFRSSVERTQQALAAEFPTHEVLKVYGSQDPSERERAKILLAPGGDPTPACVVANAQSGGAGLNFASAQLCVFLASDYSYRLRRQAEGRVDRPGQTGRVTFLDILATGPNGQRTIDHQILAALRNKQELESWSAREWLKALEAE